MVRLRRIPAVRAASLLTLTIAIPYGILLLIFVFLFSPFWLGVSDGGQTSTVFVGVQMIGSAVAGWAVAMLSIWIFIAIACGLYNVIAGRFGGIELEFRTIPPSS